MSESFPPWAVYLVVAAILLAVGFGIERAARRRRLLAERRRAPALRMRYELRRDGELVVRPRYAEMGSGE